MNVRGGNTIFLCSESTYEFSLINIYRPCLAAKNWSLIIHYSNIITHHPITHFLLLKNPQISPKPIWHLNPNMFSIPTTPKSRTHILTWGLLLIVLSEPHPSFPYPIYPRSQNLTLPKPSSSLLNFAGFVTPLSFSGLR